MKRESVYIQLLSTDVGDCIIYDTIIELFPNIGGDPEPAKDGLLYKHIPTDSDVIMQSYRFTSGQELHQFL